MTERLGHVLYWAGCVLAILIIAIGVFVGWDERASVAWLYSGVSLARSP
jgi:hypothetical protein